MPDAPGPGQVGPPSIELPADTPIASDGSVSLPADGMVDEAGISPPSRAAKVNQQPRMRLHWSATITPQSMAGISVVPMRCGRTAAKPAGSPCNSSPTVSPTPLAFRCRSMRLVASMRRRVRVIRGAGGDRREAARWQRAPVRRCLCPASRGGRWRQRGTASVADRFGRPARSAAVTCAQATTTALASLLAMACGGETELPQSPPIPSHAAMATPPATTDKPESLLVLPGKLRRDTTIADLQGQYGPGNVRIGDVPGPEGSTEQGAILFPDDPARRAYVYFHDDSAAEAPGKRVGVRSGITMAARPRRAHRHAVRRAAEAQWKTIPFRWPGLGLRRVRQRLERRHPRRTRRRSGAHRRAPRRTRPGTANDDAYPIGEGGYSSDDPAWPRMAAALVVSQLSVSFPRDAE